MRREERLRSYIWVFGWGSEAESQNREGQQSGMVLMGMNKNVSKGIQGHAWHNEEEWCLSKLGSLDRDENCRGV